MHTGPHGNSNLEAVTGALASWRKILGTRMIEGIEVVPSNYGVHTLSPTQKHILAVLLPENETEIIAIVKVASIHAIPLYPISCGNNWGYGSASPVVSGCAILDLSRMTRILAFDHKLGLVTVQPGVTPLQLRTFLAREQVPFLGPIFGSGPKSSLVGNALDRGHSLGLFTDRFSSIHALSAVLADGSLYHSPNGPGAP